MKFIIFFSFFLLFIACENPKTGTSTSVADTEKAPEKVDSTAIKAKIAAGKEMLLHFRKQEDDMKGISYFYDKGTTKYADVNSVHLYIGQHKEQYWLRFRIQYVGEDWLFIKRYMFKTDEEVSTFFPASDLITDNSAEKVWEVSDNAVDTTTLALVQKIADSKICKIRMEGREFYDDRVLTASEKSSMKNVLKAFRLLSGE